MIWLFQIDFKLCSLNSELEIFIHQTNFQELIVSWKQNILHRKFILEFIDRRKILRVWENLAQIWVCGKFEPNIFSKHSRNVLYPVWIGYPDFFFITLNGNFCSAAIKKPKSFTLLSTRKLIEINYKKGEFCDERKNEKNA